MAHKKRSFIQKSFNGYGHQSIINVHSENLLTLTKMSNAIYEKFIDLKKKANFWLEITRLLLSKRGIYIFEYF